MTTEYRQFLPADQAASPQWIEATKDLVAGNLASMVAPAGMGVEELTEVVRAVRLTLAPAEAYASSCSDGGDGVWVCGSIDADPTAWYTQHQFDRSEWEIGAGHRATDHEPTDLDADEYAAHLERKAARNGIR